MPDKMGKGILLHSFWKNTLKNLLAVGIGFLVVLMMLAVGEGYLCWRSRERAVPAQAFSDHEKVTKNNQSDFTKLDDQMGHVLIPGFSGRHRLYGEGTEIFSAEYCFDGQGYRITPVDDAHGRDTAALFFGCSFAFGYGVHQHESLPAQFSKLCPAVFPYNFAVPGYGPQHLWLQLHELGVMKDISQSQGVVLYGFIDEHINRLVGEETLVKRWGWWLPRLKITEESIMPQGLMGNPDDLRPQWQNILSGFHVGRFILNRVSLLPSKQDDLKQNFRVLAMLLAHVKRLLMEEHPGFELIVFAYPGSKLAPHMAEDLKTIDIPFLDYSEIYNEKQDDLDLLFYRDMPGGVTGHPKAPAYADLAARLADDLAAWCNVGTLEKDKEDPEK
jgi:hypothetical protein